MRGVRRRGILGAGNSKCKGSKGMTTLTFGRNKKDPVLNYSKQGVEWQEMGLNGLWRLDV